MTSAPRPPCWPWFLRCRLAATAAVLLSVAAGLGVASTAPAAAATATAARSAQRSGPPANGRQSADAMMPADSPDAVPARPTATTAPALTAKTTSTSTLLGPDVASYQHDTPINWAAVASSGQTFVVIKATEGLTYTNPYFAGDIAAARQAGLLVGTYHFAHPEESAIGQADFFAQTIGNVLPGELPPVLDLEETGGLSPAALITWTSTFLNRLRQDTESTPMIYSSPDFWIQNLNDSTAFTTFPLWEAHYTTASAPMTMGGWANYTLWQYTDTATVAGITGAVDQSRYQGVRAGLAAVSSSGGTHWLQAIAKKAMGGMTLDPYTVSYYLQQLAAKATTQSAVAAALLRTAQGLNGMVAAAYPAILDRAADPAGLRSFLTLREQGESDRGVRAQIAASAEFYADAGSNDTGFVNLLFQRLTGAPPTTAQVSNEVYALQHGVPRVQVAWNVLGYVGSVATEVKAAYLAVLGRPADAGGLQGFITFMRAGHPLDQTLALLYGSNEYYNDANPIG